MLVIWEKRLPCRFTKSSGKGLIAWFAYSRRSTRLEHSSIQLLLYFDMKSAYELAMERLAKSEPREKPLNAAQKSRLAEIDILFKGKWAEREVFLKGQLEKALAEGDADEAERIRVQLVRAKASLEEEREEEKDRVRREVRE